LPGCSSGSRNFTLEILRTRRLLGSGGYKASLLAEIVGPTGTAVSVDFDPYVARG
jgi:hypothetical protein